MLGEWGQRPIPKSLRCLLIGGAPASNDLIQSALEVGFPITLTYGLTEASSQVATAVPELVKEKPGTVGPPLPGVSIKLSEDSELLVSGPTVATDAVEADGWLHTGDLAREDPDGHLWIVGRRSDRIISGGVNVDPAEVEAVLLAFPDVREAAVVGIPDEEWGERVVAVITCDSAKDHSPARGLPPEGLEAYLKPRLSPAKRPREIRILPELPLNPNGKVDREGIRALFR
jgi:O-succinylbenzoic acid--CoA ligase